MKLLHRKNTGKHTKAWKLNNVIKQEWINNDVKEEIKRYLETNENEDTTSQNLWDIEKTILRGIFIALQAYLKKQEKAQINYLISHLKELDKDQPTNPTVSKDGNNKDPNRNK